MHIRSILFMSILIGAAAILPIHTYAQDHRENDHRSEKAAIHTDAEDKEKKNLPEKQGKEESQVKTPGPPQVLPAKAQTPQKGKRPEKAVPPSVHQKANAQEKRSVKAAAIVKESIDAKGVRGEADTIRQPVRKESAKPLTTEKHEVKHSDEKPSFAVVKAVVKEVESPPVKKKTSTRTSVQKPIPEPDNHSPSKKQLVDIEVIHTSTHRNQPSGGKTQDLPGTGSSATSFIAVGFLWETGLYLGNIYHASDVQYWYQWMNAPPSPPPEKAPFLTV
ncbi:hypothetical protein [Rossellomorea sp. NPDC077527]|uniref:hypothetical protein n=1 Tax=Rossellomorea sp. NPDC077527 TaxID=3364510 RepID=UPI0037C572CE